MKRINFTSVGEEIFNSITHGVGALLSIPGFIYLLVQTSNEGDYVKTISFVVYGVTLFLLYLMSTLYHSLTFTKANRVFQIFDHSSIFLLIAGTYTPVVLDVLPTTKALWFLGGMWVIAVLGIVVKSVWIEKFRIISVVLYLVMGWAVLGILDPVKTQLPPLVIILLLAGGLSYSLGTIFYAWKQLPYAHGVWHFFVLGGSITHYFAMVYL